MNLNRRSPLLEVGKYSGILDKCQGLSKGLHLPSKLNNLFLTFLNTSESTLFKTYHENKMLKSKNKHLCC